MTSGSVSLHYRFATLIPLSVVAVGVGWRLLRGSKSWNMARVFQAGSQGHRHPIYWFDDGSVIVRAYNNDVDGQASMVLFKIHESLLHRHSKLVLRRELEDGYDVPTMSIPLALGVQAQDFTSLLAHLYHDT